MYYYAVVDRDGIIGKTVCCDDLRSLLNRAMVENCEQISSVLNSTFGTVSAQDIRDELETYFYYQMPNGEIINIFQAESI